MPGPLTHVLSTRLLSTRHRRLIAIATVAAAVTGSLTSPTVARARTKCPEGRAVEASGAVEAPLTSFGQAKRDKGTITATAGALELRITTAPLSWTLSRDGTELARELEDGLYVTTEPGESAARAYVTSARAQRVARCAVALKARFGDGSRATLSFRARTEDTVSITLEPDRPKRVVKWGDTLVTPTGERIYGLTERIVGDHEASERVPQELGSLDRKGEIVPMFVLPTIAAYTPFYQSSKGYGLLVDGTMPGTFDVGATKPDELRVEFELDPTAGAGRWFLFGGRNHYDLNDAFSRLTGRPTLPPEIVFTHWVGHDEYPIGKTGTFDDLTLNAVVADDLTHYEQADIPAGIYHFDRPWAEGSEGFGALRFDPKRFPEAEQMLELLEDRGWRTDVWFSEWLLDERGAQAEKRGWFAPNSRRELDVTHPKAVAFVQDDLREFLDSDEGRHVDGLFVDRTDEIVPSRATDVYHDGRTGRQLHNAYPVEFQRALREVIEDARGDDGFLIARAAYTGSPSVTMTWGGDTRSRDAPIVIPEAPDTGPSTDLGLRSVLISVQRAAFMGIPYWGSDIGGYTGFASRDLFARWIEVGAASPLMRFHGKGPRSPWDMPTIPRDDPEMLGIYKRYIELHHALAPYLHELAEEAHDTGAPIVRPLVYNFPDDEQAQNLIDEWQIGDDLLAAPVWRTGARNRTIYLPEGEWVDFWDRGRILRGPITFADTVPLDRLPLYVRAGSPLLDLEIPA